MLMGQIQCEIGQVFLRYANDSQFMLYFPYHFLPIIMQLKHSSYIYMDSMDKSNVGLDMVFLYIVFKIGYIFSSTGSSGIVMEQCLPLSSAVNFPNATPSMPVNWLLWYWTTIHPCMGSLKQLPEPLALIGASPMFQFETWKLLRRPQISTNFKTACAEL